MYIKTPDRFKFLDKNKKKLTKYWKKNGFLILENFYSEKQCDKLINRSFELINKSDFNNKTIFNTKEYKSHSSDDYFLNSGDKIRFFFEKNSLDNKGNLKVKKKLAINKIGHALHDLDPVFSKFSRNKKLHHLTSMLKITKPLLLQSMYIFKQPKIGGEVVCHQDATFLYTVPQSVIGFWIALEDATINNGCMWAKSGGHKGPLRKIYIRKNNKMLMKKINNTPLKKVDTPLEAKKGTLIVLNGKLPHQSSENLSSKSRHAYTLHIIDGKSDYKSSNWLQRNKDLPLKGFI